MIDDPAPSRKVIAGSPVYFEDDVALSSDALSAALPLPPLDAGPFDELVILYRDQLFHLVEEGDSPDRMVLVDCTFPLMPRTSVAGLEDTYRKAHQADLAQMQADFLRSLHPALVDEQGAAIRSGPAPQAAATAVDRLRRQGSLETARPPRAPVPVNRIKAPSPPSALSRLLPEYDRMLFLDGRAYLLHTTLEFFDQWKRGFHPEVVQLVQARGTPWPARELYDFLKQYKNRANPRTLAVVRGSLRTRHRPCTLTLDGVDLLPIPQGRTTAFLEDWRRALMYDLKQRALEQFAGAL
jgi:hypothetical protein